MAKYKDDMYEEDPFGKTIREIYDDIDNRIRERKEMAESGDIEDLLFDPLFWEEDANIILNEIGIKKTFNFEKVSVNMLRRLYRQYHSQAEELDDDAIRVPSDPLPTYYAGDGKPYDELYKLGYTLGNSNTLGRYYLLLPDINFSRGYWMGKFEKAVSEDNDDLLIELSQEIKLYNPEKAEEELNYLVNNCFSSENVVDDEKLKAK